MEITFRIKRNHLLLGENKLRIKTKLAPNKRLRISIKRLEDKIIYFTKNNSNRKTAQFLHLINLKNLTSNPINFHLTN